MKRKLMQMARNTLLVSLPSSWVKRMNLKKGDEVDVSESQGGLRIRTESFTPPRESISLDTTGLDARTIRWVLSGLHKKGYDEIHVIDRKKEHKAVIDHLLKNLLLGFMMSSEKDGSYIIMNITKDSPEEFDNTLRRAFLITLKMGEDLAIGLRNNHISKEILSAELDNNKLTNYCERILHKFHSIESKKKFFMYITAWNLEKICDNFKYIIEDFPKDASKRSIELLEEANKLLRMYYDLYYKFDLQKLSYASAYGKKLLEDIKQIDEKNGIKHILFMYITQVRDLSASFAALHYKT